METWRRGSLAFGLMISGAIGWLLISCAPSGPPADLAEREEIVETIEGLEIADPYRWMEEGDSEKVKAWDQARVAAFEQYTEPLAQRPWLYDRFQHLWRYDDESPPQPCLLADCIVFRTKKAEQDKWVVHLKDDAEAEGRVIIDPNTWEQTETLAGFYISPDGRYAAYGKARGGDENPVLRVLDLETMEHLPDTVRGWRQGGVSWLHDSSGFFYSAWPLEGEVPEGEHEYWHRSWFHKLGTDPEQDVLIHHDPEVKETFNGVSVSEDGRWLLASRSKFNKNELWLEDLRKGRRVPVVTGMDYEYRAEVVADRLLIRTDWEAPNYRVMVASVKKPGRDHWRELIPESEDKLSYIAPVGGHLYAVYQRNASTRIAVHKLDGTYLNDVELPTIGSAGVWGYWSKPTVWVSFSSFAHPTSIHTYDVASNSLALYKESPIDIDASHIVVEQVWYPSKDGTKVSMFLVHDENAAKDGSVPYLLTGYGGFNIS
ncbi:MAG: hypothetical protein JSV80_03055, partial [Acidobacteriota bacterium]